MAMTDLRHIASDVLGQDVGREFELVDPVDGTPTGLKLRIVGPDSATARRAQVALLDELAEAAGPDGRVSPEARERARINALASLVVAWDVRQDDEPLPFSHGAVVRVLRMARWIERQVDDFASSRAAFRG